MGSGRAQGIFHAPGVRERRSRGPRFRLTPHHLYYIPRSGQNMRTADVEAPILTTLLSGNGTPTIPIHNIVFANLQFSFATWLQPGTPQGFSEVQAGYTLTGDHAFATEGLCGQAVHGTCPYGDWTKEPASFSSASTGNFHSQTIASFTLGLPLSTLRGCSL